MTRHQQIGKLGEQHAVNYLTSKGYAIEARNWHCPAGEIDIVASNADRLIFVEVKTRMGEATNPLVNITSAKRARLVHAVYAYLDAFPHDFWRIDAIAVSLSRGNQPPTIHHVEDALDW